MAKKSNAVLFLMFMLVGAVGGLVFDLKYPEYSLPFLIGLFALSFLTFIYLIRNKKVLR
jgi:TctA family transporter